MQIPILSGIYTNEESDFRISLPRNLEPMAIDTGISAGYLRPADGIIKFGDAPGPNRGGINWNEECYRVMGSKLVRIRVDGSMDILGDVGGTLEKVTMDYSFDRLAISSVGNLFYWDGAVLTQVTDVNLGTVIDFVWVDGYFMTTDGEHLVVTELTDPTIVNPLKYASSEADPDPINAVIKIRNEVHAVNRYTVEVFHNVGGDLFPFERIPGAQLQRGAIATHAATIFLDRLAFVGGGRNENIAVWLGTSGVTEKISNREIELRLGEYTLAELRDIDIETRVTKGQNLLYLHLANETLVYNHEATQLLGTPVWYTLTSSLTGTGRYRAYNFVRCYNKWLAGDPLANQHGFIEEGVSTHYGQPIGWDFGTKIVYNEGRGAIFHDLELVCLTGRAALGNDPTVWTQYSLDGETWSQERGVKVCKQGERLKRVIWFQQGNMRHWRMQRFRGTSDAQISIARLEARIEALAV